MRSCDANFRRFSKPPPGRTFSCIKSEDDKWVPGTLVHKTAVASTPAWQADALLPFESEC